jgi:hypothetical protein
MTVVHETTPVVRLTPDQRLRAVIEGRWQTEAATSEDAIFCYHCGGRLTTTPGVVNGHYGCPAAICRACQEDWPRVFHPEGCAACGESYWLRFYTATDAHMGRDGRVVWAQGRACCECGVDNLYDWRRRGTSITVTLCAAIPSGDIIVRIIDARAIESDS